MGETCAECLQIIESLEKIVLKIGDDSGNEKLETMKKDLEEVVDQIRGMLSNHFHSDELATELELQKLKERQKEERANRLAECKEIMEKQIHAYKINLSRRGAQFERSLPCYHDLRLLPQTSDVLECICNIFKGSEETYQEKVREWISSYQSWCDTTKDEMIDTLKSVEEYERHVDRMRKTKQEEFGKKVREKFDEKWTEWRTYFKEAIIQREFLIDIFKRTPKEERQKIIEILNRICEAFHYKLVWVQPRERYNPSGHDIGNQRKDLSFRPGDVLETLIPGIASTYDDLILKRPIVVVVMDDEIPVRRRTP